MANLVDCVHLGRERVIGAWEVRPGVVVDPGPQPCVETLLAGLEEQPRALLLTHVHLDHAGASGALASRFPDLRVWVHEAGARHVLDPSRLLASARRLYGDEMKRFWGEILPVPADRVTMLRGGEVVEGVAVHHVPGHSRHHLLYHDLEAGDAYTGDAAGVLVAPSGFAAAPTPPPETEIEEWLASLELLRSLEPKRICVAHFGATQRTDDHIAQVRAWLEEATEASSHGDPKTFAAWLDARLAAEGPETAQHVRYLMPPVHLWQGLERYWRRRREREEAKRMAAGTPEP